MNAVAGTLDDVYQIRVEQPLGDRLRSPDKLWLLVA